MGTEVPGILQEVSTKLSKNRIVFTANTT